MVRKRRSRKSVKRKASEKDKLAAVEVIANTWRAYKSTKARKLWKNIVESVMKLSASIISAAHKKELKEFNDAKDDLEFWHERYQGCLETAKQRKAYITKSMQDRIDAEMSMMTADIEAQNSEMEQELETKRRILRETMHDPRNLMRAVKQKSWHEGAAENGKTEDLIKAKKFNDLATETKIAVAKNLEKIEQRREVLTEGLGAFYGRQLERAEEEFRRSSRDVYPKYRDARRKWLGCRGVLLALRQEIVEAKASGTEYEGTDRKYLMVVRKRWEATCDVDDESAIS